MRLATPPHARTRSRQHGAYAVEFALVFPIFFIVVYALLSYGIVFAIRIGMQNAAEDGARAGLRYCGTQISCRQAAATAVAQNQMSWLANITVTAKTCPIGVDCAIGTSPTCGSTLEQRCQIVVMVNYDYAAHPIAPSLPGLGFLLPAQLQGRASVLVVDGKVAGT